MLNGTTCSPKYSCFLLLMLWLVRLKGAWSRDWLISVTWGGFRVELQGARDDCSGQKKKKKLWICVLHDTLGVWFGCICCLVKMIDTQPIFLIGGLDYDTEEKLGLEILGCNLLGLDRVLLCAVQEMIFQKLCRIFQDKWWSNQNYQGSLDWGGTPWLSDASAGTTSFSPNRLEMPGVAGPPYYTKQREFAKLHFEFVCQDDKHLVRDPLTIYYLKDFVT